MFQQSGEMASLLPYARAKVPNLTVATTGLLHFSLFQAKSLPMFFSLAFDH